MRVWVGSLLEQPGFTQSAALDGGLTAWKASQLTTIVSNCEKEYAMRKRSTGLLTRVLGSLLDWCHAYTKSFRRSDRMSYPSQRGFSVVSICLMVTGLILLLSGCSDSGGGGGGGGGGGSTGNPPSTSTTTAGLVSAGPITRFGSIGVGEREFETTQAEIRLGDRLVREDELRVGMQVVVDGLQDSTGISRARRVLFRKSVEGLIESIDAATNTLVVLGQSVRVDGLTVLEDQEQPGSILFSALMPDEFVDVSGVADANGVIVATRLERKTGFVANVTVLEVRGVISRFDGNARTFMLGTLVVNFGSASVTGTLGNGTFVAVRGTQAVRHDPLSATRVAVEDPAFAGVGAVGTEVELEGLVTSVTSSSMFSVQGRRVSIQTQTRFENGTMAMLTLNARLQVQGQLDTTGIVVARRVVFRFRNGGNVRLIADVEAIATTGETATLLGIPVRLTAQTQFKDDVERERTFDRNRIRLRDHLEIRAFIDAQNTVVATRLRRRERDRDRTRATLLQGPVENVAFPRFVIRGVEIRTDGVTQFEDTAERPLSAAQFFSMVSRGSLVKARGSFVPGIPPAIQAAAVALEDETDDDL